MWKKKMGNKKIGGGDTFFSIANIVDNSTLFIIGVIFEILNFTSVLSLLINSHSNKFSIVFSLFIFFICLSFFTLLYQFGICYKIWRPNNLLYLIPAIILLISAAFQFVDSALMVTVLNVNKDNIKNNIFNPTEKNRKLFENYEISYIANNFFIFISSMIIIYTNKEESEPQNDSVPDNIGSDSIITKIKKFKNYGPYILLIITTLGAISSAATMFYYSYTEYYDVIIKKNQLVPGGSNSTATPPSDTNDYIIKTRPTTPIPTTKSVQTNPITIQPIEEICY